MNTIKLCSSDDVSITSTAVFIYLKQIQTNSK